jgi:hypothetical protein
VTCNRDIEFLVEDSTDTAAPTYIKQFLQDIVGQIDIGPTANQVGVALFDNRGVNGKIDMKNQLSKTDLLRQISNKGFNHRNDQYNIADKINSATGEMVIDKVTKTSSSSLQTTVPGTDETCAG